LEGAIESTLKVSKLQFKTNLNYKVSKMRIVDTSAQIKNHWGYGSTLSFSYSEVYFTEVSSIYTKILLSTF